MIHRTIVPVHRDLQYTLEPRCFPTFTNIFLSFLLWSPIITPNSLLWKAVLEEEKRIIHALRRGVELQDYGSVKGLLAQAEKMNLTGEEVKQAQAMRLRIEVSRSSHASAVRCHYCAVPLQCRALTMRCHYSAVLLQCGATAVRCHYSAVPLQCGASTAVSGGVLRCLVVWLCLC